jgi:four helix bundle protein
MPSVANTRKSANIAERTFEFAVRVVKLCDWLDGRRGVSRRLADQLLRSGTSVGANVEEAQAAESLPDFIHKYLVALKEGRETSYWLRLLIRADLVKQGRIAALAQECEELKLMIGAAVRTAKRRKSSARA